MPWHSGVPRSEVSGRLRVGLCSVAASAPVEFIKRLACGASGVHWHLPCSTSLLDLRRIRSGQAGSCLASHMRGCEAAATL